jgi:hypothetical protein
MIRLLYANNEWRSEQLHHDESTNFEQFIDDFVEVQDFMKDDSFDNLQHFSLRYVERILNQAKIKRYRNVIKFDRRRRRKKDIFEHFRFFVKCFDCLIIKFKNKHFEHFFRLMIFILHSFCESSQISRCFDYLFNFLTKIDALCFFEWFSVCDRWFLCKASNRANFVSQITNDEVCACFWLLHCIVHFRTIWRVDWESLTIRLFRRLIAEIFVFHSRKCRFRKLWSKIITWARVSSFFWFCSN